MSAPLALRDALEQHGHEGFFGLNEIAHRESANERLVISKIPVADAMVATKGMNAGLTEHLLSLHGIPTDTPFGVIPWRQRVSLYRAVRQESRVAQLAAEEAAGITRPFQGHDAGWSGYVNEGRPSWAWVHDALARGDLDEQIKKISTALKKQGIDPEEQLARGLGPLGVTDYASATSYASPAFTIVRDITCTTLTQFNTAWAALAPGDYLRVQGVTFSGETTFANKNLAGYAEIHFDDNPAAVCTFNGFTSGSITTNPSIWITNCTNIRFFGGNIHNSFGDYGIEQYTNHNVWWWNCIASNCGGTAFACFPTSTQGAGAGYDLKVEAHNNMGNYLTVDPHTYKGGGVHTMMVGDSSASLTDSRFACYGHDEVAGDWCQYGGAHSADSIIRNTLIGKAVNYNFRITQDPTGYGILTWGPGQSAWSCPYLEATNLASRAVGQPSLTDTRIGMTQCSLDYGLATNTNIYASDLAAHDPGISSTEPWDDRHGGPIYGDIGSGGGGGGTPVNSVAPQLVGAPLVGGVLSVALGTWTNTPTSYSYQWQKDHQGDGNFANSPGSTQPTFSPASITDTCQVRCAVVANNASGSSTAVFTNAVTVVMPPPVNSVAPQINGTPSQGQVLTVTPGVWTHMDGVNPHYTYQWQSQDPATSVWSAIGGATGTQYTVQAGDAGKTIKVTETAHNSGTT